MEISIPASLFKLTVTIHSFLQNSGIDINLGRQLSDCLPFLDETHFKIRIRCFQRSTKLIIKDQVSDFIGLNQNVLRYNIPRKQLVCKPNTFLVHEDRSVSPDAFRNKDAFARNGRRMNLNFVHIHQLGSYSLSQLNAIALCPRRIRRSESF
ncbi:hypothetical protein D3C77_398520 [compost metagenome]